MSAELFIDTNILVYAHDLDAGEKHARAKKLIEEEWKKPAWPVVSVQVLQELFVNLIGKEVSLAEARQTVSDYAHWQVIENTVSLLEAAISEKQRWQLSFWDSLILAAARWSGASTIWSEDFNEGQDYGGITVENPIG